MLWMCEMCQNFEFPESDEDGNYTMWCNNPNVICVFMNFVRKYRCKYYRKIKYTKLLQKVQNDSLEINQFSFYYRDMRKRAITIWRIRRFKRELEHYLDLRDYLFSLKVTNQEIKQIQDDIKQVKEKIKKKEGEKGTIYYSELDIKCLNYKLDKLTQTYDIIFNRERGVI